jgi:hypothetical protein
MNRAPAEVAEMPTNTSPRTNDRPETGEANDVGLVLMLGLTSQHPRGRRVSRGNRQRMRVRLGFLTQFVVLHNILWASRLKNASERLRCCAELRPFSRRSLSNKKKR